MGDAFYYMNGIYEKKNLLFPPTPGDVQNLSQNLFYYYFFRFLMKKKLLFPSTARIYKTSLKTSTIIIVFFFLIFRLLDFHRIILEGRL